MKRMHVDRDGKRSMDWVWTCQWLEVEEEGRAGLLSQVEEKQGTNFLESQWRRVSMKSEGLAESNAAIVKQEEDLKIDYWLSHQESIDW